MPLSSGIGIYEIKICENRKGKNYYLVDKMYIKAYESEVSQARESANEKVYYNDGYEAIKMARAITKNCKSDMEKLEKIYNYVVYNYIYDYSKLNDKEIGYTPNIEQVYKAKKGICYDYAVLMAAMLRSVGVKTEVLIGYVNIDKTQSCHAWNRVYISESNSAIVVDTTSDAASFKAGVKYSMSKNKAYYSNISKVY